MDFFGLFLNFERRRRKKEFVSTRVVGFATTKNSRVILLRFLAPGASRKPENQVIHKVSKDTDTILTTHILTDSTRVYIGMYPFR